MTLLRFNRRLQALFAILAVMLISALAAVLSRSYTNECDGIASRSDKVTRKWQEGELTLFIRHTQRCSASDPGCPPGRDQITDEGKHQAKLIGAGIQGMGLAEFDVQYSPAIRTTMTAKLAFDSGRPANWLLEDCKVDLMQKIKDHKRTGVNLLLLSHSSCLNALTDSNRRPLLNFDAGDDIYFGVSVLLKPDNKNHQELVGCVLPSQWSPDEAVAI